MKQMSIPYRLAQSLMVIVLSFSKSLHSKDGAESSRAYRTLTSLMLRKCAFPRLCGGMRAGLALTFFALCISTSPRAGNDGVQPADWPVVAPGATGFGPPPETDWFPVQARFHPSGKSLVVNFCRADASYYCRMVAYDIALQSWTLLPNQQPDVSYFRPSYSNNGELLVFSQAPCSPDHKQCNDGYGQLATMPAQGGAITLLPVYHASRAHFTADDRRLTYWRIKDAGRLASGRAVGSVSVYEYNLGTGQETALIESMETGTDGVRFIASLTAPRYRVDGNTLFFCALNGDTYKRDPVTQRPMEHPVPGWGANCFFFDLQTQKYTLVDTDRLGVRAAYGGIGTPYVEDRRQGFLIGSWLTFADSKTFERKVPRLFRPGPAQLADADLNKSGDTAVAVTGTVMFKNGVHVSARTFYDMDIVYVKDGRALQEADRFYIRKAPRLALIDIASREVSALEWPDIGRLTNTNQPKF